MRVLNDSPIMYGSEHFEPNQESFLIGSIPKVFMAEYVAHRGYERYEDISIFRRYEISLRVLFNTRREISYLQAAM